jgi:hypothetical protein
MEGIDRITLDGSYGLGVEAEVLIYTKDIESEGGRRVTSYRFPFGCVSVEQLQDATKVGFIMGYSVEKLSVQKPIIIGGLHGED